LAVGWTGRKSKRNEGYPVYGRRSSFIEILIGRYFATDETQIKHGREKDLFYKESRKAGTDNQKEVSEA